MILQIIIALIIYDIGKLFVLSILRGLLEAGAFGKKAKAKADEIEEENRKIKAWTQRLEALEKAYKP